MNEKNRQEGCGINENAISVRQLTRMLYVEGFGASGLLFPAAAARYSNSEGFFPVICYGICLFLFTAWLLYVTGRYLKGLRKKEQAGIVLSDREKNVFAMGKWMGAVYILRYFINSAVLFYFFGLSIQNIYMPDDSMFKILFPFSVLIWYCVQTTLQKRARFLELLFPWIAFLFFAVIFFSALGLWGEGHWIAMRDSIQVTIQNGYNLLLCSAPLEFLIFLLPSFTENLWQPSLLGQSGQREYSLNTQSFQKARDCVRKAAAGIFLWNLLLWFFTIETLGGSITASSPWPVIKMMQLIRIPGGFLERFDILLAVYWVLCLVGVVSGYLYYGRKIGEETFVSAPKKVRVDTSAAVAAALAVMLFLSCLRIPSEKILQAYIVYKKWIDFPLMLLLPLFLGKGKQKVTGIRKMPQIKKNGSGVRSCRTAQVLMMIGGGIVLAGSLTGCRKQADVEEKSYIMSLYVEIIGDAYEYQVAAADLSAMEKTEQSVPCEIHKYRAKSLHELEKQYLETRAGEPEWNHIDAIFIGPELAASRDAFLQFLKEWEAAWQKSPNVIVSLCSVTADQLYGLKDFPKGSAGQELKRLSEQKETEEEPCRTPIDILKAVYGGKDRIMLYQTGIKGDGLMLWKKTISFSV